MITSKSPVLVSAILFFLISIHFSCGTMYSLTAKGVSSTTIDKKLGSLPYGSSREEVIDAFGPPHYMVTIPHAEGLIEIFEYEWGNYWYREMPVVVFKDGRLIGSVPHTYELLKLLNLLKIIPTSSFWQLRPDYTQIPQEKSKAV